MLLILLSIGLVLLAIKAAINPMSHNRFDLYFFFLLIMAGICIFFPIRQAFFEHKLAKASASLINHDHVVVECLSKYSGLLHFRAAGFVYRGSSKINMQGSICKRLRNYLKDPLYAEWQDLYALHVLTHETMHVAGEYNEPRADCQAYQRNHKMAELLGVRPDIAALNGRYLHRHRSPKHDYYSPACEPGGGFDEKLPHAVWIEG